MFYFCMLEKCSIKYCFAIFLFLSEKVVSGFGVFTPDPCSGRACGHSPTFQLCPTIMRAMVWTMLSLLKLILNLILMVEVLSVGAFWEMVKSWRLCLHGWDLVSSKRLEEECGLLLALLPLACKDASVSPSSDTKCLVLILNFPKMGETISIIDNLPSLLYFGRAAQIN